MFLKLTAKYEDKPLVVNADEIGYMSAPHGKAPEDGSRIFFRAGSTSERAFHGYLDVREPLDKLIAALGSQFITP